MKEVFRRAFSGKKGKNFRVFMLFLVLSVLIWHVEKLRQTFTVTTRLAIDCVDVPTGYVTDPDMGKSITTTIEGNGFSILKMYLTDSRKIEVSVAPLRRYAEGGSIWSIYVPRRLAGQKTKIPEHLKIVDVLTDTVMIQLLTVSQRRVPVVPRDNIAISPQRTLSAPRKVRPDSVTVTDYVKTGVTAHFTAENHTETEQSMIVPLVGYRDYRASANGQALPLTRAENGQLLLTLPAGFTGSVCVSFTEPLFWRGAEAVSALSLAGLCAVGLVRRMRRQKAAVSV